jgi:hypothetical protein
VRTARRWLFDTLHVPFAQGVLVVVDWEEKKPVFVEECAGGRVNFSVSLPTFFPGDRVRLKPPGRRKGGYRHKKLERYPHGVVLGYSQIEKKDGSKIKYVVVKWPEHAFEEICFEAELEHVHPPAHVRKVVPKGTTSRAIHLKQTPNKRKAAHAKGKRT